MFKHLFHALVAFSLLGSACTPVRPTPPATGTAAPTVPAPTSTPAPIAVPEPARTIAPILLTHGAIVDAAGVRRPEILLHFNKAMDTVSVADALHIQPAIAFTQLWTNDDRDLHLSPVEPLEPDTLVNLSLTRAAHDQEGLPIPQSISWRYHAPILVRTTRVPDLPGPADPIVLSLNYALQPWSVERAFTLEPHAAGSAVYDEAARTLTFTPTMTLSADVDYTWRFDKPLWDTAGQPLLPREVHGDFTTAPLASILPEAGYTGVPISMGVVVKFTQGVDPASAEAAFALTPETHGEFTWPEAHTLVFTPAGGFLRPATVYTVTLETSLRLSDGRRALAQPQTQSFETRQPQRLADFGPGAQGQVIDADGRRAVQFAYDSEASRVIAHFELRAVPFEDFIYGAAGYTTPWGGDVQPVARPDFGRYASVAAWDFDSTAPLPEQTDLWMGRHVETTLPADVAPGLYVLEMSAAGESDALWIALTRLAVQARRSEHQVLAWVTDINGAPIDAAAVAVHAVDGRTLASGVTGSDGLAKFELEDADAAAWITAVAGADRGLTGLVVGWQGDVPPSPTPVTVAPEQVAFITTDRPIYRPGDVVHFKAILRRDDDGALAVEPEREVIVRMRDARDNLVRTIYLRTDAFGAVDSLFRLAEGATLGDYAIEVVLDGESHRQSFQVEEYRKPDIAIDLTTDAAVYAVNQIVRGAVDSKYFFDAPVADADVSVSLYDVYAYCDWEGRCDTQSWMPQSRNAITGKTDLTGRFVFTTLASTGAIDPYNNDGSYPARVGLEATVTDDSGVSVSAHLILNVYPSTRRLSWVSGSGLRTPGETTTLRVSVTDLAGEPVAGQKTRLEVRRWNERSLDYSDVFWKTEANSDAAGRVEATLRLDEPGYYRLVAHLTDPGGRAISSEQWLWVYADAAVYPHQTDRFGIEADRAGYAPGDVAVLTIHSDFSGPALLTIGRTGLLREQIVTLTSPITRVNVPILPTDTPNLNVSVSAWRQPVDAQGQPLPFNPDAYYSQSDSALMAAQAVLLVPPTDMALNVSVTADRSSYAAGAQAAFDILVTDAAGGPVQAQLTLALVDEAIFRLREDQTGPIFDAFYFAHASRVTDFNSFEPSRWLLLYDEGGRGGGGGDGAYPQPRSNFADTAVWEPSIVTDADGRARVTVTLPDTLTTWRLTARAATVATQVGETTLRIVTRQDLVVRPVLPETLTSGDDLDLTVVVHNNTEAARVLDVGLLAPAGFELRDPLTQSVQAPALSTVVVGWRARALEAGERRLTFWVMDPEDHALRDAVELPLTVHALAVADQTTRLSEVRGQQTLQVDVPAGVLDQSRVDLVLSASIAGNLTDGLDYLTGYPYGCVEQTMSRALPNAVVARAFRELGLSGALDATDMTRKIDASVQRLYGFQHTNGGWGWWTDDATDDYQTAWVIFGLTQTRAAGYEVDPAVIERGARYLTDHIDQLDPHTRAFALYSLAVSGYGDLAATQAAAADDAGLDAFSQANLALALHLLGDTGGARTRLARLGATVQEQDGLAYWSGADQDGHYHEKTMASTTRSTALALSAYVAIAPDSPLVAESVRYLMSQRRADGWGSTNETSFTILALTDYLLAREQRTGDSTYTISVNGREVAHGVLNADELSTRVSLPASSLRTGANDIAIVSSADTLFLTATERWYTEQARVEKAGVVDVQRRYTEAGSRVPLSTYSVGEIVQVTLIVDLPRAGSFILIEDTIPGGLEPINERLNTSAYDHDTFEMCGWYEGCSIFHWEEYGYNQKEIRSDRVSFFVSAMKAGSHTITYLARALRTGRFTALPATVSAMYDDTLWGRSDSVGLYVRP